MVGLQFKVVLMTFLAMHCHVSVSPLMALAWDLTLDDTSCCPHKVRHHKGTIDINVCRQYVYFRLIILSYVMFKIKKNTVSFGGIGNWH